MRARASLVTISSQVVRSQRINENIDHVKSRGRCINQGMLDAEPLVPIPQTLLVKITANAVIINAISDYFRCARADSGIPVVGVPAPEHRRITISIQVQRSLNRIEIEPRMGCVKEQDRLQSLIFVEIVKRKRYRNQQEQSP